MGICRCDSQALCLGGRPIDQIEETLIANLLGAMTAITFANVIARYVFNSNILWALELTVFLFAWLVLFGRLLCVRRTAHLGVDVVLNMVSPRRAAVLALISCRLLLAFAFLLLKGAWDYWAPFAAELPPHAGAGSHRLEKFRGPGWYEVDDIPMPSFLRFLEVWINQGEAYEKLPRCDPLFHAAVYGASAAIASFRQALAIWDR